MMNVEFLNVEDKNLPLSLINDPHLKVGVNERSPKKLAEGLSPRLDMNKRQGVRDKKQKMGPSVGRKRPPSG
jgi:hypothetical protein